MASHWTRTLNGINIMHHHRHQHYVSPPTSSYSTSFKLQHPSCFDGKLAYATSEATRPCALLQTTGRFETCGFPVSSYQSAWYSYQSAWQSHCCIETLVSVTPPFTSGCPHFLHLLHHRSWQLQLLHLHQTFTTFRETLTT